MYENVPDVAFYQSAGIRKHNNTSLGWVGRTTYYEENKSDGELDLRIN